MLQFYLSLLIFAMLSLFLLVIVFFGKVQKHRKRNQLGLPVGQPHYYFIILNERIHVVRFFIFYLLSAAFAVYELYLYYTA